MEGRKPYVLREQSAPGLQHCAVSPGLDAPTQAAAHPHPFRSKASASEVPSKGEPAPRCQGSEHQSGGWGQRRRRCVLGRMQSLVTHAGPSPCSSQFLSGPQPPRFSSFPSTASPTPGSSSFSPTCTHLAATQRPAPIPRLSSGCSAGPRDCYPSRAFGSSFCSALNSLL